jgi:hypothetical protein
MICGVALLVLALVLPHADLLRGAAGVGSLKHLATVALANTVVLVSAYLAAAALIWGIADATMAQPRDLEHFDERPADGRTWRIAHLSDLHVVGERYGFRLESGRSGPRGNERRPSKASAFAWWIAHADVWAQRLHPRSGRILRKWKRSRTSAGRGCRNA